MMNIFHVVIQHVNTLNFPPPHPAQTDIFSFIVSLHTRTQRKLYILFLFWIFFIPIGRSSRLSPIFFLFIFFMYSKQRKTR